MLSNVAIVFMLAIVVVGAFSGGFYAVQKEKETYAPIYKGSREERKICLMINVYWGTEYVLPMAELFKKYNFNTTFLSAAVGRLPIPTLSENFRTWGSNSEITDIIIKTTKTEQGRKQKGNSRYRTVAERNHGARAVAAVCAAFGGNGR